MSNVIYYNERKGEKFTFIDFSNRRDTSLRISKIKTRMLKKLYDRQNLEYEIVNIRPEMCDLINDYNGLTQNLRDKKVNINNKKLDAKTIKILAEIN